MYIKKNIIERFGLFVLYFLYIFNCSFVPLPYFLRTRVILGIIGIAVILLTSRFKSINKYVWQVSLAFLLLAIPIFLTSLLNTVYDVWLTQYLVLLSLHFIAAFLIVLLSKKVMEQFSVEQLIRLILAAVLANSLLAVVMFFVPSVNDFLLSIQNFDDQANLVLDEVLSLRLVGLGIGMFFMGGIIWGIALLFIAYLIRRQPREKGVLKLSLLYMLVTAVGVFIARTALVGAVLGLVYIAWPHHWGAGLSQSAFKKRMVFFGSLTLFALAGILLINRLFPEVWDSTVVYWALELFFSLGADDGLSTQSTQHLETMFIWPDNWKTWLIGDGLFNDENGYYMGTDVGYLRLIYYFGILGTVLFFVAQFYLLGTIYRLYRDKALRLLLFFLGGYILLLNVKGFADVNAFLFLLLWTAILPDRKENRDSRINIQEGV